MQIEPKMNQIQGKGQSTQQMVMGKAYLTAIVWNKIPSLHHVYTTIISKKDQRFKSMTRYCQIIRSEHW